MLPYSLPLSGLLSSLSAQTGRKHLDLGIVGRSKKPRYHRKSEYLHSEPYRHLFPAAPAERETTSSNYQPSTYSHHDRDGTEMQLSDGRNIPTYKHDPRQDQDEENAVGNQMRNK